METTMPDKHKTEHGTEKSFGEADRLQMEIKHFSKLSSLTEALNSVSIAGEINGFSDDLVEEMTRLLKRRAKLISEIEAAFRSAENGDREKKIGYPPAYEDTDTKTNDDGCLPRMEGKIETELKAKLSGLKKRISLLNASIERRIEKAKTLLSSEIRKIGKGRKVFSKYKGFRPNNPGRVSFSV